MYSKRLNLSKAMRRNMLSLLTNLMIIFVLKKNIIHERACFHPRVQKEGETVEAFIFQISRNWHNIVNSEHNEMSK